MPARTTARPSDRQRGDAAGKSATAPVDARSRQPAIGLLDLQQTAGNRAVGELLAGDPLDPPEFPSSLFSGGRPLDPDTRERMESRFETDFSQVRVHTEGRPARSAQSLGALAYTTGNEIVFRPGEYQPWTTAGRQLLTHELTHVVQSEGRTTAQPRIESGANAWESEARQVASMPATASPARTTTGAPPAIRMTRDPRIEGVLAEIEAFQGPFQDEGAKLRYLFNTVRDIDLTDADNLRPIAMAVRQRFGDETMIQFLTLVNRVTPERRIERTSAAQAQHQQLIRLMQVDRRGPYGTYGGVALPIVVTELPKAIPYAVGRAVADLAEMIINLFRAAGAFLTGLVDGVSESVSPAQARELAERLLESSILNLVFPPIFLSGAVAGIVEDVVDTIRSIYNLTVNISEIASATLELLGVLLSPEGQRVAHQLGQEIGKSFAGRILGLLRGGVIRFTFELGRFIGPTIVYTVLAFLGVPQLLGAAVAGRLISILRPLLSRFPRLLRLAGQISRRLPRGRTPDVDVDVDLPGERPPDVPSRPRDQPDVTPEEGRPPAQPEREADTPGGGGERPEPGVDQPGGGLPGTTGIRHLPREFRMPRQGQSSFPTTSRQIGTAEQRIQGRVRRRGERVGPGEQGTQVTDIPSGRTGLRDHWREHGGEFPEYRSAREYERGAIDFCRDGSTRRFYYRSPGGRPTIGYYNVETNTFAATSVDGRTIYTYFRPDDVATYVRNIRTRGTRPGVRPRRSVPTR